MRRDRGRLLRRALLGLLVVVTAAVVWSLRRPSERTPSASPRPGASPGQGTTVAEGSLMRFREGNRQMQMKWRSMAGREGESSRFEGVELTLPYVAEGRTATATITASEAQYLPTPLRLSFRGHVKLTTDDGFELESESLKYWGPEARAFTRDPVRFRRGATSGSADQMEYTADKGVWLGGHVLVRLEEEAGPPLEISAGAARGSRVERLLRFDEAVVARQGSRELHAHSLELSLSADLHAVERAVALDDVVVVSSGGEPLPGTPAGGGGRRLRCHQLEVSFRSKGVLQDAVATRGARLELEPGPTDPREHREIGAPQLRFAFDELGRLASVTGQPLERVEGGAAARQAELVSRPVGGAPGGERHVRSDTFTGELDPTGGLRRAEFAGRVSFDEPGRRAEAPRASYDDASGLLRLTGGEARVADDAQGSVLTAKQIEIGTRNHGLTADENVRHTISPQQPRPGGARPLGGDEPTVLLCRQFEYDSATKTARYRENALMRSGQDEIRAPLIVLEEPAEGRRRLSASGGVDLGSAPAPRQGPEAGAAPGRRAQPRARLRREGRAASSTRATWRSGRATS